MELLDLPPEILHEILYRSILARSHDFRLARALRLKLVCKIFYHAVERPLFETGILKSMTVSYNKVISGTSADFISTNAPSLMEDWRLRRSYGMDLFWHRYLLYRVRCDPKGDWHCDRYTELKTITQSICNETGGEFDPTLESICWLALEGAVNSMTDDRVRQSRPFEWKFSIDDRTEYEPDAVARNNMLSAAAYFNLIPLAKKLLQEGGDPNDMDLFEPAVMLAAFAGNESMLKLLQEYDYDITRHAEIYGGFHDYLLPNWRNSACQLGMAGAAMRGDAYLLHQAVTRPSFTYPDETMESTLWRDPFPTLRSIYQPPRPEICVRCAGRWTKSLEIWKHADAARMTPLNDFWKQAALVQPCWYGNLEIVQYLVEHRGTHIHGLGNEKDREMQPLVIAARASHVDIVEYLLERGADPNEFSLSKRSPLDAAAAAGSLVIVKKLLDAGATEAGHAFVTAAKMEHEAIMDLLLEAREVSAEFQAEALEDALMLGLESIARKLWRMGVRLKEPLVKPLWPKDPDYDYDDGHDQLGAALELFKTIELEDTRVAKELASQGKVKTVNGASG